MGKSRRISKMAGFIFVLFMTIVCSATSIKAQSHWVNNGTKYFYQTDNGTYATGWQKIDGSWYYMNSAGEMQTGWIYLNNHWYYLNSDGKMQTGWVKWNGNWYYMCAEGSMQTGWQNIDDSWYYLSAEGSMQTGWQKISGTWYYMCEEGSMLTGWQMINGQWYYFHINGNYIENNTYEKGTIKGIDVSHHQGSIDWNKVKNSGVKYTFIRVGHDSHVLDRTYKQNIQAANAVGIPVGVYFYSTAENEQAAIQDAQFVIDNIQGYKISYPIAIDLEDSSLRGLGKQKITNIAKAFCEEIQAAGYTPMVYCNEDWYKNYIDFSQLDGIERWIARYNVEYTSSITRNIWQSGSTCRIDGINGNVDCNFGLVDYTQKITPRTKVANGYVKTSGVWKTDSKGRWYSYFNGGFPANKWERISGKWYWFNTEGYMTTGWQKVDGYWYYMDQEGAMKTGWQKVDGSWYYMNYAGEMQLGWIKWNGSWYYMNYAGEMTTGWQKVDGYWYYMDQEGAMKTGWQKVDGSWYYMNYAGEMQLGWIKWNGSWYYMNYAGEMTTGWQKVDGYWYYMDQEGAMKIGWQKDNGSWYYMNYAGEMTTGWQKINNAWYYFYWTGEMAYDTWIGSDYVCASGEWIAR